MKSLLVATLCLFITASEAYTQASNCRPQSASGFGSSGTIVFEVDKAFEDDTRSSFLAGLGQWTGSKCSGYRLPSLVTSAPFCLVNCDRETWKVRATSRRICGTTNPSTKTIYLNPDLPCDFTGTSAHEIGHVLNLRDVHASGCEDATVMWWDSTSYPPVTTTDCAAAQEANPHTEPPIIVCYGGDCPGGGGGGPDGGGGGGGGPDGGGGGGPVGPPSCTTIPGGCPPPPPPPTKCYVSICGGEPEEVPCST